MTVSTVIGLITPVLLGLGAGAFLVAHHPSFWIAFGARLGKASLLKALKYITRRCRPGLIRPEAHHREAGQGDEWLRAQRQKMRLTSHG